MTDYLAQAHTYYKQATSSDPTVMVSDRVEAQEAAVACALIDIAASLRRITNFQERFVGGTR